MEKVEKYQELSREIARLWRVEFNVIHLVVRALVLTTKNQQVSSQ